MQIKDELREILRIYTNDDQSREQIINASREILKLAKQTIYAVHRSDFKTAQQTYEQNKEHVQKTKEILNTSELKDVGAFKAALEEFVESAMYLHITTTKTFPKREDLGVPYETYLAALCDCSGELARRCVLLATENKTQDIKEVKQVLDEITASLLEFDFRSGELRKKIESLKYNLIKVEQVLYDIHIKK